MVFALYGSSERWMTSLTRSMQEQPVNSRLQGIADCKDKQLTSNKYGRGLVMLRNNAE